MSRKRFTLSERDLNEINNTNAIADNGIPCTQRHIVKLLNELADENEQLRKENDMFSCELSVSANKEISRNCRIAELEEENEQLKKRIAHLKNKLAYKDQHNTEEFRGIEDWARGGF